MCEQAVFVLAEIALVHACVIQLHLLQSQLLTHGLCLATWHLLHERTRAVGDVLRIVPHDPDGADSYGGDALITAFQNGFTVDWDTHRCLV